MSLHDRLADDLKTAMKARDQLRMDVIRMIKAAIMNKQIELKKDLDDADLSRVMTALVKQRREAVEHYQKANRADLADKEQKEIAIIEAYLPKAVCGADLERLVTAVITETGASGMKDMGAVMKAVMARLGASPVDGKQVSDLVRAKLSPKS